MRTSRIIGLGLGIFALLSVQGCRLPSVFLPKDDITVAKEALDNGQWIEAQHALERYLLNEENPDKRWQAWQMILLSSKRLNPDGRFYLEHVSSAYEEFKADPERAQQLLRLMAESYAALGMNRSAADAFMDLSKYPLATDESYAVLSRLATLELTLGSVEEADEACAAALNLPVSPTKKAEIFILQSEIAFMVHDSANAEAKIQQALQLQGVDKKIQARLYFMLGDIKDMNGQREEAVQYFTKSLHDHPNPNIVEYRLNDLREKIAKAQREAAAHKLAPAKSAPAAKKATPAQSVKKTARKKSTAAK